MKQNGSEIYKNYGFNSVVVERVTGDEPGGNSGGLSPGVIAGIVIPVLLVTTAVVLTAAFIL